MLDYALRKCDNSRAMEKNLDMEKESFDRAEFYSFAAKLLGVPAEGSTAFGESPEWDSVAHLRLVMETEARWNVTIPLGKVLELRTLEDFALFIEKEHERRTC